jgi:UDP-N-acetyl-D-glucosamine/UDP-N-acetyl-D-galactosamine dehydrogenase
MRIHYIYAMQHPTIAIIGLGYVGLPLAMAFSKLYKTIGFDIDAERVTALKAGQDKTRQTTAAELTSALQQANTPLLLTAQASDIREADVYIVTVPTPVDAAKKPDLRALLAASKQVGAFLQKGNVVIYESTVYPGCTEEDCVPVLEAVSGLRFNEDFYVGYSPERINPGDTVNTLTKIKKVTSGSTPAIGQQIDALYASIITAGTHLAPSIRVAEAAKAIENAQRDVNISFVNELALIFDRMGVDTKEVLAAAATKWNFLPFKPGLVGGHCIGVDPYYLAYKAEKLGYHPEVILSGRRINDRMGVFIAGKLIKLLSNGDIRLKGARVLVMGVAFKENCPDIRNTKVVDIVWELQSYGVEVLVWDPWADPEEVLEEYGIQIHSEQPAGHVDGLVVAVAHDQFMAVNYAELKASGTLIYDVKGIVPAGIADARL